MKCAPNMLLKACSSKLIPVSYTTSCNYTGVQVKRSYFMIKADLPRSLQISHGRRTMDLPTGTMSEREVVNLVDVKATLAPVLIIRAACWEPDKAQNIRCSRMGLGAYVSSQWISQARPGGISQHRSSIQRHIYRRYLVVEAARTKIRGLYRVKKFYRASLICS